MYNTQILLLLFLIAGGCRAVTIAPTTSYEDIEFLKSNISAIWEELSALKEEVWESPRRHHETLHHEHMVHYGGLEEEDHEDHHSQEHLDQVEGGYHRGRWEVHPKMKHEWEVHHGGLEELDHDLHHNEDALSYMNYLHNVETQQQKESRILTHEHHVHFEDKMHDGHEEHHDEDLFRHLTEGHGHVDLEDMDESDEWEDDGDTDQLQTDDGHIIDVDNDPYPDHYYPRRPCPYGRKCRWSNNGPRGPRPSYRGGPCPYGGDCPWGPTRNPLSKEHSDYHNFDEEDYVTAVCKMKPNRGIPRRERQPVKGKIIMKQKKTGGPVTYVVNLSGFSDGPTRQKRHFKGHSGRGRRYHHGRRRGGHYRRWHRRNMSDAMVFPGHHGVPHGFHVHEGGDFGAQHDCSLAGGHFNPLSVQHGGPQDDVRHIGDLGNLMVTPEGFVKNLHLTDHISSLMGDNTIIGRSLVIHAHEDDLGRNPDIPASLTSGNAGPRLACCVVTRVDDRADFKI